MSQIINQKEIEDQIQETTMDSSSKTTSFESYSVVSQSPINGVIHAQFLTDPDRTFLQRSQILRVRELEEINDDLQRQLIQKQGELKHIPHDPFNLLKDIENLKMTIAFNAGEILKIYAQNRQRLNRIHALEALNVTLRAELSESESDWAHSYPMHERATLASRIFLTKDEIDRNNAELFELKKA